MAIYLGYTITEGDTFLPLIILIGGGKVGLFKRTRCGRIYYTNFNSVGSE